MGTYTYPNYPHGFVTKNVTYGIGDRYLVYPDTDSSPMNFGSVVNLDFSDFNSTYTDPNNPYKKKIFELKNGYSLNISLVYIISPRLGISYNAYWADENGDVITIPTVTTVYSGVRYFEDNYRTSFDETLGKMVFLAVYPTNTIPEVSETNYFEIAIYFKTKFIRYIGIDLVTLENELEVVFDDNQTQTQYFNAVPYDGVRYRVDPCQLLLTTIDFDGFSDYIKGHGTPFPGDVFVPDGPVKPPAGEDDPSGPGGGGGNYDDTSDPIDFPDLPTGGALESGAVNAHLISKQSLQAIMAKLWSNSIFDILNMWQKSITDPMDAVVSLHALPVIPSITTSKNVLIGNFDTEISTPVISSQYVEVDCGTLNIREYWGSALDYSPYTKIEIFLPFIGIKELCIEDAMNNTLHVKYHVDVLTGDCIAFIKCGISVLYHYTGNCRMTIPLTSKSTDALQTTIGETGKMLSGAAMAGATGGGAFVAGMTISAAANVASSKIRTGRSGDISGSASLMDDFVPYVIIHRPVQSLAKDYNKFKGYPSNITSLLGSLSGYTEVEHVHLSGIPNATSAEMDEIKNLLKEGVIL